VAGLWPCGILSEACLSPSTRMRLDPTSVCIVYDDMRSICVAVHRRDPRTCSWLPVPPMVAG
jgi:hypothetical protein